jgi:hypothetical protein
VVQCACTAPQSLGPLQAVTCTTCAMVFQGSACFVTWVFITLVTFSPFLDSTRL